MGISTPLIVVKTVSIPLPFIECAIWFWIHFSVNKIFTIFKKKHAYVNIFRIFCLQGCVIYYAFRGALFCVMLKSLVPIDRKFHGHDKKDEFVLYKYIIKQCSSFCKYTDIRVMKKKDQRKWHVKIKQKVRHVYW